MTDYTKMPLGPIAPGRIGEIVECPHCHENGLKVEDFKDPDSRSLEKEIIYIHSESAVLIQEMVNGRFVERLETTSRACPIKLKTKPL